MDGILGAFREGAEGLVAGQRVLGPEAPAPCGRAAWGAAVREACDRIAPAWALDACVAVNPYFELRHQDFERAGLTLMRVAGSAFTMPRPYYRERIAAGRITRGDIAEALKAYGLPSDEGHVAKLLARDGAPPVPRVPLVSHVLQETDPARPWAAFCVERISRFAAAYFDTGQASWPLPWRSEPLYDAWRSFARLDASPRTLGLKGVAGIVAGLPRQPLESIALVLKALAIPDAHVADYCHAALLDIGGWATCARHPRPGHGRRDVEDLLAIRLAWDLIILRAAKIPRREAAWRTALSALPPTPPACATPDAEIDYVLQAALELGYRRRIIADLAACVERPVGRAESGRATLQAVFCMGAPSEVLRRALEAVAPGTQTIGFSGFCGLPLARAPFEPSLDVGLKTAPPADGPLQGGDRGAAPALADADRSAVAGAILRAMSLTEGFARLVLLIAHDRRPGHEPRGARAGRQPVWDQIGAMDAHTAAALLNDRAVRARLAQEGIAIPADTRFLATWYDRARDEAALLEAAQWEATHAQDLRHARAVLKEAGLWVRRERDCAPVLAAPRAGGSSGGRPQERLRVCAEQESVGSAAFIAAPRARTEGMALEGRASLHDYDWRGDEDSRILRFIMTAPMMAAHWMNMRYYASVVDHERYGGGNGVRHSMRGGSIGVLEGAEGDPGRGLPVPPPFGGAHRVHEPMRLSAFVEAPRERMDDVLAHHDIVRNVVEHGWLFLFQMDGEAGGLFLRGRDGLWRQLS